MLGAVEAAIYSTVYPSLPPIVIVPFVTCFFFAVTLAFCRKQWVIGIVAFLVTALVKGPVLPGQFMIPAYGLLFQAAKGQKWWACGVAGFAGSALHVPYGVLFAPLIFSVAPATAIVSFVKPYTGGIESAIAICTVVFGLCGMLAAEVGSRTGVRIRGNMNHVQ
jgi:hypothetical protein